MAKMRVHQLAKELGLSSKLFIQQAQDLGYTTIKSHANTIEDDLIDELRKKIVAGDKKKHHKSNQPTVLRRRTKQTSDGSGYRIVTTRLSGESSEVIESKDIEIPVLPQILIPTPSEEKTADKQMISDTTIMTKPDTIQNTQPTPPPPAVEVSNTEKSTKKVEEIPSKNVAIPSPIEKETSPPINSPNTLSSKEVNSNKEQPVSNKKSKKIDEKINVVNNTKITEPQAKITKSVEIKNPSKSKTSSDTQLAQTPTKKPSSPQKAETEKIISKTPSEKETNPIKQKMDVSEQKTSSNTTTQKEKKQTTNTTPKKQPTPVKSSPTSKNSEEQNVKLEDQANKKQKKKKNKENKENKRPQSIHILPRFEADNSLREQQLVEKLEAQQKQQRSIKTTHTHEKENTQKKNYKHQKQRLAGQQELSRHQKGGGKKQRSDQQGNHNLRKKNKRDRRAPNREKVKQVINPPSMKKKMIKVDEAISVGELAHKMGVKATEIIRKLLSQGMMVTINQALTVEVATQLAKDFGYEVQNITFQEEEILQTVSTKQEKSKNTKLRSPVVTVMGHVDHGKTSLLDAIRETNVAAREAGGITQHIGASVVELPEGRIVFLDTPGHEAFTAMRSRGAQATDIVILVVAADDGVMPQTEEAILHSQAAGVPIVVAINKIDKQGSDSSKVRLELTKYNLLSEDFGGDVLMIDVSAHTKEGLPELLESILLQSEMMELSANPETRASGIVIETRQEKGRGPVATVLIQEGTLSINDAIVVGTQHGKVRAMLDHKNKSIKKAGPSTPIRILGLSGLPAPGEKLNGVVDEKSAKQVAEHRQHQEQQQKLAGPPKRSSFADIWNQQEKKKELNIILKADVQGTLEALKDSLLKLRNDEIETTIQLANVGGISESDVNLAATTNSIIIGFQVRADNKAQRLAESEGIELRTYRVIYDLLNDIKSVMQKQLTPTIQEKPIGQASVRKVFSISKIGKIAGCYVTDGKITRNSLMRLYRNNIQIYEGKISSLRRFQNDAKEVTSGYECGIQIEGYQDIRVGDLIEAYELEEIATTLNLE